MWEAIVHFFDGRSIEGFVSSILFFVAILYYIPKGIIAFIRIYRYKGPDEEYNDNDKPRKPQDYL